MTSILLRADELIHGQRVTTYGKPTDSFPKIAKLTEVMLSPQEWKELASGNFPASVGIKWMIAQKFVREHTSPNNPDHLTDACGYLGILHDLKQEE